MKALYCYDGPLYRDEEGFYYGRNFNDQMFERYFKVVDSLEIVIRIREMKQIDAVRSLSRIQNPNISVTECPNLSSVKGLLTKIPSVYTLLEDRISKADVVFVRVPSNISNIAIDICEKLGKKYLVEVVGCQWDAYWNYSLKGKVFALPAMLMMKKSIKNAPYVLYVTNEFLQKRYPTKGKTINCSNVELAEMSDVILEKRKKRIESYDSNTKFLIGTAAGLDVLFKGQEYIIKALGELKKRGISCFEYRLVGGGTGERLMKIAQQHDVADQVKIMGQIPQNQIYDWLDGIDIYAQPSRQEGLPRAVIEAMSRGVPCIGARTAGIPELLEDSYVFSNSKTEVEEICEILIDLINDKRKLQETSIRNFEEAKKYQRNILIERRTAFFNRFVNESV